MNDDSSLGWQQANFASPVTIAANTVYVASYYAPEGGYAEDVGYFENSGVTSGPLYALSATEVTNLSNSVSTGNGVYVYGTGGGFPTSSYAGTNYWVDVAFNVGTGVAPPPSVTAQTPAPGATGVSTALSTISATFNEPVNPSSISVAVTDASGNSVTGSLSYNSSTNTIIFTPNNQLALSTQYTVTVGGATDALGHTMTAPVTWSFTTAATPTYTLFPNTATPAISSVGNTAPQELGVKFESAVPGYIAGIRFYKGTGNNGTHVGYLYTSTGTLLASATFTNESAAGWQEVDFSSPVAIAADTVYVAAYYAPDGDYSADSGYFASSGVTSGPLTALSNTAAGGNGVYAAGDVFPTSSFNATQLLGRCRLQPGHREHPAADRDRPDAGPGHDGRLHHQLRLGHVQRAGPAGQHLLHADGCLGQQRGGTLSYNAATETATFTPTAALATSTQYTATISGVTDFYDHTLAAPVTWSFTTSAQPTYTLWNSAATPAITSVNDAIPRELGVKFESAVAGYVTGILFYKGSSNTGTHVGHLCTSTGNLLATATFTNETATGWQQVTFANPVAIAADTVYIASYFAPNGGYAADGGYFASSGVTSGPLTALSNAAAGGNGVYADGGGFPTSSYNATNYWVDVDFNPGNVNTPPPTVTAQTPAAGAANVSTITPVSVTFSEAIQPSTISFTLTDASGNPVSGSLSYDATSNTATFTPNTPLSTSTQYTATISGATDYYDNTLATPVTWSFTTSATPTYTLFSNATIPSIPSVNDPNAQRAGREVRVGRARLRHRHPVLQGDRQHRHPRRPPLDQHRHPAGHGHLHRRDGHRLAAGDLRQPRGHRRQHRLRRLLLRPQWRLRRRQRLLRQFRGDQRPAHRACPTPRPVATASTLRYGGGFPTSSYNATNYWVDVVFNPGTVNTPPPTVTAETPAPGATGVSTVSPSRPRSASRSSPAPSPSCSRILGNTVSGSVSYNATTNTATFTPTSLATSTKYTATVSGATDYYGNALTPPGHLVVHHLRHGDLQPLQQRGDAGQPLGQRHQGRRAGRQVRVAVPGYITGIRFYKGTGNTGTHVGYLWSSTGTLLATATFTNETASGLAAGDLRQPGGHRRQHRLRRLVLCPQRRLRRRRRLLRQLRGDQRPAPAPVQRRGRRQRRLRLRYRRRLPGQLLQRHQLLGRRRVQPQ